ISKGGDFIVNVSNDAWFGPTTESIEHLLDALPRAIENRVPLVRCANSGVSTMIAASGRFITPLTNTFEQTYQVADIHPPHIRTLYTRYGDWLGWLGALGGFWLASRGARRWREKDLLSRNHEETNV